MQPHLSFDWNDARYLLAVARQGGTQAAGRALGVNATTVQRRLAELERVFGRALVRREVSGYCLTPFGRELLPLAQRLEMAAHDLEQHVRASSRELAGVVRVTCPDALVPRLNGSPLLERFRARFPLIHVEFVMSDHFLDLRRGEADLALRVGEGPDDKLVGHKIADSVWGFFASRAYVKRHGQPRHLTDLGQHPLACLDETVAGRATSRWLRKIAPAGNVVARASNMLGLVHTVKSGVAIAPLPIALGGAERDLVKVLGPIDELSQVWRLVTTRELRKTPRIAALFDFLLEEVESLRPILP